MQSGGDSPDYLRELGLQNLDRAALTSYYQMHYTPENAAGATAAGAMMGLGVAAWAGRKLWRRRKSYGMGD